MPAARLTRSLLGLGLAALTGCALVRPPVSAAALFNPLRTLEPAGSRPVESAPAQLVLVSYFATWCLPCMAQIEDLRGLQERFAPRGFTVVAVGMDLEGALVLNPFVDQYQLPFPVLIADEAIRAGQTPYGRISALPASYLVHSERGLQQMYAGVVNRRELERWIEAALQP